MLAMRLQADKLYSSPGPCEWQLNSLAQGNKQCCRWKDPVLVNRAITLSRRPLAQACKRLTASRNCAMAGNGKGSGGWPPSGPIYQRCAGAAAPFPYAIRWRVIKRPCLIPRIRNFMIETILVMVILIEALILLWQLRQERVEIERFLQAMESKIYGCKTN